MKRVLFYLAKMADASATVRVKKIPDNLYEVCLTNLVNYLQRSKCERNDLRSLPDSILMDVYYKMLQEKRLCILGAELSELDIFERLLRFSGAQLRLLQCFQAVIEHGSKLSVELASGYLARCDTNTKSRNSLIQLGLRLGGFLNEAGWYADAQRVLLRCRDLCQAQPQTTHYKRLTLECCHRLLNTQSAYCCFPAAAETYTLALKLLGLPDDAAAKLPDGPIAIAETCSKALQTDDEEQQSRLDPCPEEWCGGGGGGGCGAWGMSALLARLCKEFSALFFVRCDYSAAHAWSMRALSLLTPHTPAKITIEVLRACGKACVVKRRFSEAGLLVRQGVALARAAFGPAHPRYAAALLDYGFYLLNIDSITHSVAVYEEALSTLRRVFGRSSLHVATAQEDLAYALYVLEYSSGRFYKARDHAERAIRIIENLVPPDHLLLASAKRVKALILEEIALDTPAGQDMREPSLLEESESLHKAALELSMMAFGEKNVQTAKHYGNLGRLYQSMQKFQDAETMHLKAIAIKEELLGAEDYEVGLSVGHLASLYNYHMNMHRAAEKLYLRSISISLKLFGERYSGLEYDYRGLVHVFTQLKRHDRAHHYNALLQHWHDLREQSKAEQQPALGDEQVLPLEQLQAKFFADND
ncbi:amyloid protein-binding protein 2 isoform X2 [Vanessa tameamea]|uniref:Amyloid protein-binding protein 2 isoform X2 n=1 Tax=Vanessa tameamea TaxID=334116 RepID=A0A8B8HU10_VANTA|nr:amyloid protein-binding protein 2 isoform X1 [Vanessa tameamea]XP_047533203.1 amyloid protein-binding protein 2 isoform X2 [Vanessa atalanta]